METRLTPAARSSASPRPQAVSTRQRHSAPSARRRTARKAGHRAAERACGGWRTGCLPRWGAGALWAPVGHARSAKARCGGDADERGARTKLAAGEGVVRVMSGADGWARVTLAPDIPSSLLNHFAFHRNNLRQDVFAELRVSSADRGHRRSG